MVDAFYEFDGWRLLATPGNEEAYTRLAGLHESLHGQLNDSSAYGTLLHIIAWIFRNRPNDRKIEALLENLMRQSIEVHEAYATYLSLLIVGEGEPHIELLNNYPTYQKSFKIAEQLAQDLSGAYLRYHAVAASLRACMQSKILDVVLEKGIQQFDWFCDVDASLWPDRILTKLAQALPHQFWQHAFQQARQERPDLPGWDIIQASETNPHLYAEAMREEFDPTFRFLMEYFHNAIVNLLPAELGLLSFNGHQLLVSNAVEAAEELLSEGPILVPLRPAAPGETPEEEIISSFRGERIFLRKQSLEAVLKSLDMNERDLYKQVVAGEGERENLFLIARPTSRNRQQYTWKTPPEYSDEITTAFRRVVVQPDGQRWVEHILLDRPGQLLDVLAQRPQQVPFLCSISMAVFANQDWSRTWLSWLLDQGLVTVLVDLDPFEHFKRWSAQEGVIFRHATMNLSGDHVPNRVFALQLVGAKTLFLIPCTSLVVQAMTLFMREQLPNDGTFLEDSSILLEQDRLAMGYLLGHLLSEELFFDFNAGRLHQKGTFL